MEKHLQRGFVTNIDIKRYEHNVELGEFVQGDIKSSYLGFNIKNGDRPYDLTDCEVIYQIKKPDGTKVSSIGEISMPTRGYVECAIGGQALLIDGICELELSILKNGAKLTSHKIRYMVNPSLFETIGVSQDEVTVLSQLMDRVHEYVEIVRTEEEKRNNSENSRIENEKQRELAETDRDTRFDKMVNDLEELKPTFKGDKGDKGEKGEDGKSIEFTWRGTKLGVRQSGTLEYSYTDLKGDKGDCESIDLNNFYNKQEADNRFIDEEELNDKGYLTEHQDISGKVDKVEGKQLSTEDYTTLEKAKLSNVEEGANKYIHPSTHSANIIEQDSNHRFVTDEEKSKWNSQVDSNQLHTHSNKNTLDKITEQKLTSWDNKSDFSGSYNDLTDKPNIPSVVGLATESYVNTKVAGIVDSAPETLNTLNELSIALGNDPNFATTVANQIGTKADKSHNHNTDYASKSSEHNHANKTTLDKINDSKIANWNDAYTHSQIAHDYAHSTHDHNASQITEMTGYAKPPTTSAIAATDSLNVAIGKLEKSLDEKQASGSYAPASHTSDAVTHITADERAKWNAKSNLTLGNTSSTAFRGDQGLIAYDHSQVAHAPANAEQNVQADWNEANTGSDAYIKNKPTIPIVDVNKAYVDAGLDKKADKTSLHTHSNKAVLDGISSAKVTEWNNKSTFSGAYNDLTGIPANFTPMEHRHNASEIDNLPSGGSIDFGANNNWTGTNTFANLVKIIGNNEVQRMEPANANSACFYAFYKDKQSRSGYFGYGSAYNNTFVIGNDKNDADVNVETKGAGKLKTNGVEVATIAYVDNLIGTINTQLENIRNGVLE